jgi:FtsZ-interacting cell division protein ZipA
MDDNTFKLALAIVGMIQIVALAFLGYRQTQTEGKVATVHTLVNGLSHEKSDAIREAAQKEGELLGRDSEKQSSAGFAAQIEANRQRITEMEHGGPMPVEIVNPEPLHVQVDPPKGEKEYKG